jgi:hypothetical protein
MRLLSGVLGVFYALTGLFILSDGHRFYELPDVVQSGPFNAHFVLDIGAAFLVAGLGIAAYCARSSYWPAAVAGTAFVGLHAVIHLVDMAMGMDQHVAQTLAEVVIPAILAVIACIPRAADPMRKWIHRILLRYLVRHYRYDIRYLEFVLDCAPGTYYRFFKVFALASRREGVPLNAFYAAKLVGARHEDCGPCTQLVTDMALAAGVSSKQVEAVLEYDVSSMHADTALAVRFATAVVEQSAALPAARAEVHRAWGDAGVVGLSFATQVGRLFPMLKGALGFAEQCQRITIGQRDIVVSGIAS